MSKQLHRILLLLFVLLVAVACRQEPTLTAADLRMDMTVTDSLVGETTITVTITDAEGNAVENPGTLSLRGDMDHAGMVPVIASAEDSNNGVFVVPFEWTMGGAWMVEATLTLPDDTNFIQEFSYEILTEAGADETGDVEGTDVEADEDASASSADDTDGDDMADMDMTDEPSADAESTQDPDMSDMDMSGDDEDMDDANTSDESTDDGDDMGDMDAPSRWEQMVATTELIGTNPMDMSDMDDMHSEDGDMGDMDSHDDMDMGDMHMDGETSAVYMLITNNGEDTVTITGVTVAQAGLVELHETVVEDDVARMMPVNAIEILAGETAELRPGGMHIMLMQLTEDLVVDETVDVDLMLESGDTFTVSALVQDMLMDDIEGETVVGDLTITNIWARPASGGMSDMDSEDSDMGDMDTEDGDMSDMDSEDGDMGDMDSEDGDMSDMDSEDGDMGDMDSEDGDMGDMDVPSRWEQMVATTELIGTNPMDMSGMDSEDSDMGDMDSEDGDMSDMDSEDGDMGDMDSEDGDMGDMDSEDGDMDSEDSDMSDMDSEDGDMGDMDSEDGGMDSEDGDMDSEDGDMSDMDTEDGDMGDMDSEDSDMGDGAMSLWQTLVNTQGDSGQ